MFAESIVHRYYTGELRKVSCYQHPSFYLAQQRHCQKQTKNKIKCIEVEKKIDNKNLLDGDDLGSKMY